MAYDSIIALGEIQSFFPSIEFDEETSPTSYEVESWIIEATALVYSAIAEIYAIPVTDDNDLAVLKIPAREYVLANVKFVLGQNTGFAIDKKKDQRPKEVNLTYFFKLLEMFKNGKLKLLNTADASGNVVGASYNVTNGITHTFDSREDNW